MSRHRYQRADQLIHGCCGDEITPNDSDWFGATSACDSSGESAKLSRYFNQHPEDKNETAIDDDMMHQISVLLGVPNSTASQAASKVESLPNVARRGGGVARRRVA
jgi:hypothetical protein